MGKAGILVESHADILDRMFWAEVPEAGKKSVLLSHEAPCVPPRNVRQFVEVLLERGDKETAAAILRNYVELPGCQRERSRDARSRLASANWLTCSRATGGDLMARRSASIGEAIGRSPIPSCKVFSAQLSCV